MKVAMNAKVRIKQQTIIKVMLLSMALITLLPELSAYPYQNELTNIINLEGRWKFSIGERAE